MKVVFFMSQSDLKKKKIEKKFEKKKRKYPSQVHRSFAGVLHGTNSIIMSFLRVFAVKVNNHFTQRFASIWYDKPF